MFEKNYTIHYVPPSHHNFKQSTCQLSLAQQKEDCAYYFVT